MTILIIASKIDPASINIKKALLKKSNWKKIDTFNNNSVYKNQINNLLLVTINDQKIMHDNIDIEVIKDLGIKPKLAIFISRHTSITGKPSLTVHPIGNYGKALFGGCDKTIIKSSPKIMTELLRILKKKSDQYNLYHNICFEVTHHGPKISIPSLFIEIGSNLDEWTKKKPADAVAESIIEVFDNNDNIKKLNDTPVLVGIGGGHYAPRFTDVALDRKVAFGHMIPTYQINAGVIDNKIIEGVIQNTPEINGLYIHKKALKKSQVTQFKEIFKSKGLKTISSKDLQKIS
jgi:D-aminoacyl-tRNA deacylase